uniref:hypothetical protein n=1 Tax=Raoultella ornithinolytica TaxID=54291 RepID=UPI00155DBCB3|nr:hypothetical protein [Raoultella ornithinolytica]
MQSGGANPLCCREGLPAGQVNKGINMSVFALVVSIESDYPNALFAVPFSVLLILLWIFFFRK